MGIAISLCIVGSAMEMLGVVSLSAPALRQSVPKFLALLLIAVGGLLFAAGVVLLVTGWEF